ncbi:MAG TPA: penicillin-binding protein 2 [Bacillota bacterium]|nr:penicillin-binding protein 2 [Bacillota bacterium]
MKDQALKGLEFRFHFFSGLILIIFAGLFLRLWFLQIIRGNEQLALSRMNQTRILKTPAPRGVFYDRNGKVLAYSRISHVVSVVPEDIKKNPRVIAFLSRVLQLPQDQLLQLVEKKGKDNPETFVPILNDVDAKAVGQILEAKLDLPGVEVDDYPVRYYPMGEWAAHLFGYMSEINADELKDRAEQGYRMGDMIGKTGLESAFETYLRGKDGGRIIEVDRKGQAKRVLEERESYPGNNLILTIDKDLQDTAEQAFREQLNYLQTKTKFKHARSGTVVALDPRNGHILALVSYPGYDPNLFVGGKDAGRSISQLFLDPLHPFTNRATQGTFMPGSTFKPITVMTALEEGKADKDSRFFCSGFDRIYHSLFKCWNYKQGGHGRENVIQGLQNSCNIVMGELGRLAGIEQLAKYSRLFGLGSKTGISFLPEEPGLVGDPAWKKKAYPHDSRWYPLETLHYSIGQGYVNVTAMQLANVYAALANGGKFYIPQAVQAISNPEGKIVKRFGPHLIREVHFKSENLALVRQGLNEVISNGTARSAFAGFPLDKYPVAGKTGTAQNVGKDDYALFASYAPANNHPEIVVVVIVEEGGHGASAGGPVARKIYETYFHLNKKKPTSVRATAVKPSRVSNPTANQSTAPAVDSPENSGADADVPNQTPVGINNPPVDSAD